MNLIKILQNKTEEMGSFTLEFNSHKEIYVNKVEDIKLYYLSFEELEDNSYSDVDFERDIYRLTWYNLTPVGFYKVLANSLDELEDKVLKLIKEEGL